MLMQEIIILTIVCAGASAWLYTKWSKTENNYKISDDDIYSCVTKGDMYCSHIDWCDAEIALYPEQYEADLRNEDSSSSKK